MFSIIRNSAGGFVAAALLFAAAGCSSPPITKVAVSGTAAYKGEPLEGVMLRAVGANGEVAAAIVNDGGTFTMTDVPVGEIKVGFTRLPVGTGSPGKAAPKKAPPTLPTKYIDPQTSGLTYTITPETREIKIVID